MFCQKCGTAMADTAAVCASCNTPIVRERAAAVADTVKAVYGGALAALKGFAGDPVGRLPATYSALGDDKARRIGLAYGIVSMLCFLLGGYLLLPFKDGLFDFLGFGGVLKCLLFAVAPFGCTALASLAVRKAFGGTGGIGADLFVSGAALLPVSLAMVIDGLLGFENYQAMALVGVFAGCTTMLMLFSGYSRIAKLSERAATLAVPIVVVLVFWLGKTLASSVLEGGFGGGGFENPGYGGNPFDQLGY